MKYYMPSLWKDMNSENEKISQKAGELWSIKSKIREENFEKVKKLISKKFLKSYQYNNGFHDWQILSISCVLSHNDKNNKLLIELSQHSKSPYIYLITFYGINDLKFDKHKTDFFDLYDTDEYSFDEWEVIDDKLISYRLLMLSFSTIELTCKGVMLQRTKKTGDG